MALHTIMPWLKKRTLHPSPAPGHRVLGVILVCLMAAAQGAAAQLRQHGHQDAPEAIVAATLDVLTFNIAHARGQAINQLFVTTKQHRSNLDAIAGLLQRTGAAAVALQEADAPSWWSGSFDHVDYLASSSGHGSHVHDTHAESWIFAYGTALLSRARLNQPDSRLMPSGWFTPGKGFVRANIDWRRQEQEPAVSVTVVSAHFDFSSAELRRRQARDLIENLRGLDNPLILAGDFNADWSGEDSIIRMMCRDLGLHAYRPEAEDLGTFRGDARLDWILISEDLEYVHYEALGNGESDHLAVLARIEMKVAGE